MTPSPKDDVAPEELEHDDMEIVAEDEAAHVPSKIKSLKEQIKTLKAEKQEYLSGWQAARAELVNTKKRLEEEHQASRAYLNAGLLEDILPVLDSFSMAMDNTEAWEKVDKNWRQGIEYIRAQFEKVLQTYGVTSIEALGAPLDTRRHEPVDEVGTDDESLDGCVAAVLQNGYMLHERVLRPAKVTVYSYQSENS